MMASSGPVTLFGHVCSIGGQKTASYAIIITALAYYVRSKNIIVFTQVYINFTDVHC